MKIVNQAFLSLTEPQKLSPEKFKRTVSLFYLHLQNNIPTSLTSAHILLNSFRLPILSFHHTMSFKSVSLVVFLMLVASSLSTIVEKGSPSVPRSAQRNLNLRRTSVRDDDTATVDLFGGDNWQIDECKFMANFETNRTRLISD